MALSINSLSSCLVLLHYPVNIPVRYLSISSPFRFWNRKFSILSVSYRYWYWKRCHKRYWYWYRYCKKSLRGIGIGFGIVRRVSEVLVLVSVLKPEKGMVLVLVWYRLIANWSIGIVSVSYMPTSRYWSRYRSRNSSHSIGIGIGNKPSVSVPQILKGVQ